MKGFVLDTHVVAWHLAKPAKLGRAAKRLLHDADQGKARMYIPAIVLVELAMIKELKRMVTGPVEVEALCNQNPRFEVLPMDLAQAKEFVLVSSLRDPFDRMVVAAARCLGVPLLTADGNITASKLVSIVWG
jgi:PIN domain nuclease of toxin-antitoxin system